MSRKAYIFDLVKKLEVRDNAPYVYYVPPFPFYFIEDGNRVDKITIEPICLDIFCIRVPFNLLKEDKKSVFILKLKEIKIDNNYYRYIHHYGLEDNETYIDLQSIDKKIRRYKGNKIILKSPDQSFLDGINGKNGYIAIRML